MSRDGSETADWRAIYRDLRSQIDRGDPAAGSRLPTIAGLAAQTGLTQHGARRVLERLRDEGRSQSCRDLGTGFPKTSSTIASMVSRVGQEHFWYGSYEHVPNGWGPGDPGVP